jgi:hypothetical protein
VSDLTFKPGFSELPVAHDGDGSDALSAADLPPQERELFLKECCANDEELYAEISSLLDADNRDQFGRLDRWRIQLPNPGQSN